MTRLTVSGALVMMAILATPRVAAAQLPGNPGRTSEGAAASSGQDRGGDSRNVKGLIKRGGRIAAGAAVGGRLGKVISGSSRGTFIGTFLSPTETAGFIPDMYPDAATARKALAKEYARQAIAQQEREQADAINRREREGGPGSIRDAVQPGRGEINDAPDGPRGRASTVG